MGISEESSSDETPVAGSRNAAAVADPGQIGVIARGRVLAERYRLERPLGRGGMAAVWLATDERLDRQVAVKVLADTLAGDEEYLARFRREARTAASLQHPNLVAIWDFGAGERPYLVMEYISGGDLAERAANGAVSDPEAVAAELLSALEYIHGAGILHRDIKPHNVLIDDQGHARLTDFGIAQPRDATSLTRTGHVIGTERYIAPEVKRGEPASERSDLFALGVVLGEIAKSGAGARFWELADSLTAEDPQDRPASAAGALELLEGATVPTAAMTQPYETTEPPVTPAPAALAEEPPASPPPTPAATSSRGPRGAALGVLALALIGAVLAIGLALGGGDEEGGDSGSGSQQASNEAKSAADGSAGAGAGGAEAAETTPAPETTTADSEAAPAEEVASADGAALNDQGFALNGQGRYDEAVPILEQAVDSLEPGSETYYYALYNLGEAYLYSGDPAAAIPVLEERMEFDDGQLGTVQATLDEAYAAAGETPPEGKPDKPGKGPKKTPPGLEDD